MTDVVVLAAGLGRRLATVTALPKWLTPVGETCPADAQLAAFDRTGVGRTLVVVGEQPGPIEQRLAGWHDRLHIELVPNERSADRNNWFSLLLGLDAWAAGGAATDVAVVNSDLFSSVAWFTQLLGSIADAGPGAALAVDPARGRTDEAMKVAVGANGLVTGIGKVGVPAPDGEYVGLAWLDPGAAQGLRAQLARFLDQPDRADHWYEHAIAEHIATGAGYRAVAVPSSDWVEIDDEADLVAARRLHGPRPGHGSVGPDG